MRALRAPFLLFLMIFANIFNNCANLKALDKAAANQSTLRKSLFSVDDVVESEDFLSTLLLLASDTEKEHKKY